MGLLTQRTFQHCHLGPCSYGCDAYSPHCPFHHLKLTCFLHQLELFITFQLLTNKQKLLSLMKKVGVGCFFLRMSSGLICMEVIMTFFFMLITVWIFSLYHRPSLRYTIYFCPWQKDFQCSELALCTCLLNPYQDLIPNSASYSPNLATLPLAD